MINNDFYNDEESMAVLIWTACVFILNIPLCFDMEYRYTLQ